MSLGEVLPLEIARVKRLIADYLSVPTGGFAATLMKMDIDKAEKAIAEGDILTMIAAYESLKEWKE